MGKYSDISVKSLLASADLRLFIDGCDPNKRSQQVTCPVCGKKKLHVKHEANEQFAKCYGCEARFANAADLLMKTENCGFIEAIEKASRIANMPLMEESRSHREEKSFVEKQLAASGLDLQDVTASVVDDKGREEKTPVFIKGSIDEPWRVNRIADDMLILYYGLDGRRMTYARKGVASPQPYVRVRWANPALHLTADGKECKYKTPPGAPTRAYIPQRIRQAYQSGEQIETLFIQEGEKKAEKACKHGILSIGIQGINNFGSAASGLLAEIQEIAKKCQVKNMVLLMDADWDDLHKNIVIGDDAAKRPNAFAKCVIKFKQYISSLHNQGLSVDVWFGHINKNENLAKGLDDVLVEILKGREAELAADIDAAMHATNGAGQFVSIHKITALSDLKILDFWLLNDDEAFFQRHRDRLENVESFKIKKIRYRVDNGKLDKINGYASEADIWSIKENLKTGESKIVFNMTEALDFLRSNGFFKLRSVNADGLSSFDFVRMDDGIIERTSPVDIRDFVYDYISGTCKQLPSVKEFFASKLDSLLADKKLERLDSKEYDFVSYSADKQTMFYNNGQVEISTDAITPGQPMFGVWRTQIIPRKFKRIPIFSITREGDSFRIDITEQGQKCEFLAYLLNTSNNAYQHDCQREMAEEELREYIQHIVNKITAIGYLLCDYKFASDKKCVVAQDHKMSEVNRSEGGVGKSILGEAIGKVRKQVVIDGKSDAEDKFAFEEVTRSTRSIFIDDIKINFNFERLYPMITGEMKILRKNLAPLTIPSAQSPKILISTNHTINKAQTGSTFRRIKYIEFSSWYNKQHTIFTEFGHMFFDDWDDEQWMLFDNFMAECAQAYLRSFAEQWGNPGEGIVDPPMKNINLRNLRQEMGEMFLQWAEEFFDPSGQNLNSRVNKYEVRKLFFEYAGQFGHGVSNNNFTDKIKAFCKFKGYDLNPNVKNDEGETFIEAKRKRPAEPFIGGRDTSGGKEFYTIYAAPK